MTLFEDEPGEECLGDVKGERVDSIAGSPVINAIAALELEAQIAEPGDGERDDESDG